MNNFVINSRLSPLKESLDKLKKWAYKEHQWEQIIFRFYICQKCLEAKKCDSCNCNPLDKLVEPISCNKKMFPNMMSKSVWEDFKKTKNINIL